MRRLIIAVMFCILLSTIAYAELCQDQDEQPDIEDTYDSAAKVEYGIEDKTDHCLSGKNGYTVSEGRWLREYYCDSDDKRAYKDVDCIGEGFDKCEGGKCTTESGKTQTQTTQKTTSPTAACGNKKIESALGEKCDPPDSICYSDDGDIGICTRPNDAGFGGCQCDVYKGSASDEAEEEVEEVEEEPEEVEEEPEEVEEEVEEEPEAEEESTEEARAPLPTENYNEMKGVSVTRSITNSVKSFFSWIGSWFS